MPKESKQKGETMNELIRVEINENHEPIMSARELHEFLEIGTKYKDWFPRMVEYGFEENQDYIAMAQKRATAQGNMTEYTDHLIKLDMAKEIAMIQRSEKGKIARRYFIQIEKEWNSPEKVMARALRIADESIKSLQLQNTQQKQIIGELKPKADYTDRILNNKGLVTITQIAKDYGMSGQAFNGLLHDLGVQYKQSNQWLLYQRYHDKGYTHSHTIDIVRSDGSPDVKMQTKWTMKGRLFLYELLKNNDVLPVIEQ